MNRTVASLVGICGLIGLMAAPVLAQGKMDDHKMAGKTDHKMAGKMDDKMGGKMAHVKKSTARRHHKGKMATKMSHAKMSGKMDSKMGGKMDKKKGDKMGKM